jgi:hypothetical protein
VELKTPDMPVAHEQKEQCDKYVRELAQNGLLTSRTKVRCFVLRRSINPIDRGEKTEMDERVQILPLGFSTVLRRAESRLLRLHDKIKSVPFLQERGIDRSLDENTASDGEFELKDNEWGEPLFYLIVLTIQYAPVTVMGGMILGVASAFASHLKSKRGIAGSITRSEQN